MKQKTFTVLFIARKAKQLKNGEIPIYLQVTVNGTRDEISTYQSVKAKKWDSKKWIAKGIGKKENELNHYLDAVRVALQPFSDRGYPNPNIEYPKTGINILLQK